MQVIRESVFLSALRVFCAAFAAIIGVAIAVALVGFGLALFSNSGISLPEEVQITIAPDAKGNVSMLHESAPAIVRINIEGLIGEAELTTERIERILYASQQHPLAKGRVKGIFLYINSPGGIAYEADGIYRSLVKFKKDYNIPVYALVNGICASGGMYIAAAADKIYATSESIIGSIGVVMGPTFNFSQAMSKIGIESLTLTEGKDKDMLNPFRPWKTGEDSSLRNILSQLYNRFVDIMVTNRPQINKEHLIQDYGAQVFLADQALTIGYIDETNSNYDSSLSALTEACGIAADTDYQVLSMSLPHSFLSSLVENKWDLLQGKITHEFKIGSHFTSSMCGKFLYLYEPAAL